MTMTSADIFEQMRAHALSMGLFRAASIVRWVARARVARAHGYADHWTDAVRFLQQDLVELRGDGAHAESITALLKAAFGDSPELAGLRAELIAKLTEAVGDAKEPAP